ncbi:MAG: nucleotidyltransferase family protein [Candidatus Abyssubacteria bacterium]
MSRKPAIDVPYKKIEAFCRKWKVSELSLFGSVLRKDFDPASDVDVLVSFLPGAKPSLFDRVRMEEELSELFGRQVDLVQKSTIERSENYIRRRYILDSRKVIYVER